MPTSNSHVKRHAMGAEKSFNINHQVSVIKQSVSVRHFKSFKRIVLYKDCMVNDIVYSKECV